MLFIALTLLCCVVSYWYFASKAKAISLTQPLHSRPSYHGGLVAIVIGLLSIFILVIGASFKLNTSFIYGFFIIALLVVIFSYLKYQNAQFRARNQFEGVTKVLLLLATSVAVITTVGIIASVLFESIRFFGMVKPTDFLFGTHWSPFNATGPNAGQSLGFVPLLVGTLLITFIALLIATPIGLMAAICLSEYASPTFRKYAKPFLEILAGIPTVVLGFFAALTIAPLVRDVGQNLGLTVAAESALAAGFVMGMMIIPFISSLSDDVINAIPQSLRDGSLAMGATQSETIKRVILPAAMPGIVSAFMLALSRAIGETMIVVMAAGLAANLTLNPLDSVTTITVQIKSLLTGDQEFDSAKTLVAFALGLVLFGFTLILNTIALFVVRRFKEQYD